MIENEIMGELISENFKLLRENLHFIEKKEKEIIIVTSTIPQEGKSSIVYNYGVSEAMAGKRVIIVDCDIRRPKAHENFKVKPEKCLLQVLKGEITLEEAIVKDLETNLDLLPSQKKKENVTEIFMDKKIVECLEKLKNSYDLIIIDTAPLAVATDALLLSEYGDGILYVVGYNMVSKNELIEAKKLIDKSGCNLYGIVVNRVGKKGYTDGNYGYYDYNHKYFTDYIKD
ncbi:MAG: tyrosine-protein kinase family protein [Fusobacteriaceae bacterium]